MKIVKIILLGMLFISCNIKDNSIYFNLGRKTIYTCNKLPITHLSIESEDGKDSFIFSEKFDNSGTNSFSLTNISTNYSLENFNGPQIPSFFHLRPNQKYVIGNYSYGDATESKIEIRTNNLGEIVFANITKCN